VFRRTQDPLRRERSFDYRAVTSYGGPFQTSSSTSFLCNSVQSVLQPQEASLLVWANPVSLAATQGIAFAFSSSGYLDVSVPRVCLLISYEFRYGYHSITSGGFPHSEISGSKLAYSSLKHIGGAIGTCCAWQVLCMAAEVVGSNPAPLTLLKTGGRSESGLASRGRNPEV